METPARRTRNSPTAQASAAGAAVLAYAFTNDAQAVVPVSGSPNYLIDRSADTLLLDRDGKVLGAFRQAPRLIGWQKGFARAGKLANHV